MSETFGILLTVFASDEFHSKLFISSLVGHEKEKNNKSVFMKDMRHHTACQFIIVV